MTIGHATGNLTSMRNLPVCAEDSLCVVDGLTGSRAATSAMLINGEMLGAMTMPATAEAGAFDAAGATGRMGGAALPRGAIRFRGGIWTASQVMQWIQGMAERSQIEAAIARFGLDRGNAADLLAARAYVWAQNLLPLNLRYWNVPASGDVNKQVAEAVMRYERSHPGTALLASQGDETALRTIDAIVAGAIPQAPTIVERTSAVSPALSANSTRARGLLEILENQRWQAHHIIPFATVARLPVTVQRSIAASGWRMDSLVNLIALPANLATYLLPPNLGELPYHSGSHSVRYDVDVWNALQPVAATAGLMTPAALETAMEGIDLQFRVSLRTNRLYHFRLN